MEEEKSVIFNGGMHKYLRAYAFIYPKTRIYNSENM
jgi:hypothetical protein